MLLIYYGGGIAPVGNLVLKTSGTRDGMEVGTSLRRQANQQQR